MHFPGRILHFLGANGPVLLVLSLVAGAVLGPLITVPRWGVPLAALLLTLGSFTSAALSPFERRDASIWSLLAALLWVGLVMPVGVLFAGLQVPASAELMSAIALAVIAPPTGSAAAVATMLGLRPRLALLVSVTLTLLAPVTVPLYLRQLGIVAHFDLVTLEYSLAMIVGLSALFAAIAVRRRSSARWLIPDVPAAAGIAVIGLMIIGWIAAAKCVVAVQVDPAGFLTLLALALGFNAIACLIGTMIFISWGARAAMTVGLCNGNRNVTLVWAIAGGSLTAVGEDFIAAAVLPILLLPLTVKAVLRLQALLRRDRRRLVAV